MRSARPVDYVYLALVTGMVVFGLAMLASASAPSGYERFGDSSYFLKHQVIFGFLPGLALMLATSRIPYQFWKTHAWECLLVSLFFLVLVFIPGLSAGIGTAHSWIDVGGIFSIQPSEFVKLTFLFYLAAWLETRAGRGMRNLGEGLMPFLGVLAVIMVLLVLQPDVGTMTIIAAMALAVYFVAGAPMSHLITLVAVGIALLGILIGAAPYRAQRFITFLNPQFDPQGIGYHVNQALLAVGSGGVLGEGYGHSRQKFQYLPEVVGDSLFAVIAEEMGFLVCVGILALFIAFVFRTVRIGLEAPDPFAKYVCVGIAAWISLQAFVNIGSMVALLPITGLPLPFMSYGGTSLAVSMAAVGVVLNISRNKGSTRL